MTVIKRLQFTQPPAPSEAELMQRFAKIGIAPGADKASNWLPAPEGAYDLIMRIYGPDQAGLDGSWKFPEPQKR